jgi:hypothetical protein
MKIYLITATCGDMDLTNYVEALDIPQALELHRVWIEEQFDTTICQLDYPRNVWNIPGQTGTARVFEWGDKVNAKVSGSVERLFTAKDEFDLAQEECGEHG